MRLVHAVHWISMCMNLGREQGVAGGYLISCCRSDHSLLFSLIGISSLMTESFPVSMEFFGTFLFFTNQNEGVKPPEMAIDQPSHKFLAFLAKHYGLRSTIPQRYKFVIFDGFFKTSPQRELFFTANANWLQFVSGVFINM